MMTTKPMSMLERSRELEKEIIQVRRHIHAHPELSFQEFETAKLAAEKLKSLGYSVKTGVGKTGVVANIGKGKTVAIRADMDGLPIDETNNVAYKSKNKGVMHACGHDAHVACGLATAEILAKENLNGGIRILMQPAEENVDDEGKSGAFRMIEEGAMEGVHSVIGLHMDASIPAGIVGIQPGPVMAAADIFKIVVRGKGGHGAYPEATIDSVVIASEMVQAMQQIVSRRIAAHDPAVVTVGAIHSSSTRGNVISEEVTMLGTIRSFNETVRQKLIAEVERVCKIAEVYGAKAELEFEPGYPATVNHPDITAVMHQAACDIIGSDNVITIPPKTWAEDFSMLAQASPGAFMFLGGEITGDRRAHHSPNFDLNESGLILGPAILAETAKRLLQAAN